MRVYVLETGAYENSGVMGAFSSVKKAQAAVGEARPEDWRFDGGFWSWSGEGKALVSGRKGSMDDCADIYEYEVDDPYPSGNL